MILKDQDAIFVEYKVKKLRRCFVLRSDKRLEIAKLLCSSRVNIYHSTAPYRLQVRRGQFRVPHINITYYQDLWIAASLSLLAMTWRWLDFLHTKSSSLFDETVLVIKYIDAAHSTSSITPYAPNATSSKPFLSQLKSLLN